MRRPEPLPSVVLDVARTQEGLVDTHQLLGCGMSSARITRNVRYGTLTRVFRGVYDVVPDPPSSRRDDPDAARDDVLEHRRLRRAWLGLLAHGPQAVAVGQTALALHGVQGLPLRPPVEVTRLDRRQRVSPAGVTLRRYGPPRYVSTVGGRMLAPVPLALAQALPTLARREAVAVLDSSLHRGLVDDAGLREARELARGRRNVARTNPWWELVDGRAESPAETWARLDCLDLGVAPDTLQREFVDVHDHQVARCDLAWWLGGGRWLVCEIDGKKFHETPDALYRDRRRQNPLVAAGHVVVRYSGSDARSGVVGREIHALLQRLGWRPGRSVPPGPTRLPR